MKLFYRISDAGHPKPKIADKWVCLLNFMETMVGPYDDLHVIADNASAETTERASLVIRGAIGDGWAIEETRLGNAGSWRRARDLALSGPDPWVYFAEDDYLHLPGARQLLEEGLAGSDYVTLYDHLDKYLPPDRGGNPFAQNGGEVTRVIVTRSRHWKLTNSTTMTFGARLDALRRDQAIWDDATSADVPRDFAAFMAIRQRGGSLISPIPSKATHCEPDLLAPFVDWKRLAADTAERVREAMRAAEAPARSAASAPDEAACRSLGTST